jgi:hypothetical protein
LIERYWLAAVAVMDQAATMDRTPVMDRLIESIEHEVGVGRRAHPPARDIAGINVDHDPKGGEANAT